MYPLIAAEVLVTFSSVRSDQSSSTDTGRAVASCLTHPANPPSPFLPPSPEADVIVLTPRHGRRLGEFTCELFIVQQKRLSMWKPEAHVSGVDLLRTAHSAQCKDS